MAYCFILALGDKWGERVAYLFRRREGEITVGERKDMDSAR